MTIESVDWRFVGLYRDPKTNKAYLQIERHPGHPFDSIELSESAVLTLACDSVSMVQRLRDDLSPSPPFIEEED